MYIYIYTFILNFFISFEQYIALYYAHIHSYSLTSMHARYVHVLQKVPIDWKIDKDRNTFQ